jgi:hypothetical protein
MQHFVRGMCSGSRGKPFVGGEWEGWNATEHILCCIVNAQFDANLGKLATVRQVDHTAM